MTLGMSRETAGEIVDRAVLRGKRAGHPGGEARLDIAEPVARTADIGSKRSGAQPRRGKLKPLTDCGKPAINREAQPLGPVVESLRRGA